MKFWVIHRLCRAGMILATSLICECTCVANSAGVIKYHQVWHVFSLRIAESWRQSSCWTRLPLCCPQLPLSAHPQSQREHLTFCCRGYRDPASTGLSHPFAMMFQMGTLESTKDRSWTWILAAPIKVVQKAGVDFDPDTRSVTAIQGDAPTGSVLEVGTKPTPKRLPSF